MKIVLFSRFFEYNLCDLNGQEGCQKLLQYNDYLLPEDLKRPIYIDILKFATRFYIAKDIDMIMPLVYFSCLPLRLKHSLFEFVSYSCLMDWL